MQHPPKQQSLFLLRGGSWHRNAALLQLSFWLLVTPRVSVCVHRNDVVWPHSNYVVIVAIIMKSLLPPADSDWPQALRAEGETHHPTVAISAHSSRPAASVVAKGEEKYRKESYHRCSIRPRVCQENNRSQPACCVIYAIRLRCELLLLLLSLLSVNGGENNNSASYASRTRPVYKYTHTHTQACKYIE